VFASHLRYDTLAQMLTLGNIHAGGKVLVFETCAGMVLGAVMERMGGTETLCVCVCVCVVCSVCVVCVCVCVHCVILCVYCVDGEYPKAKG